MRIVADEAWYRTSYLIVSWSQLGQIKNLLKYITRFALPVYNEKEKTITYNTYKATLVVRISKGKKLKLYDITEIKKETSTPP